MAAYIRSIRWVPDPLRPHGGGRVADYFVDTPDDIATLPDNKDIKESSTAFVTSTQQVYTLTEGGWRLL
jgi:hypothetical protein